MTTSASGGEAYFALSTEWRLWHAYRPFVGPILKGSNGGVRANSRTVPAVLASAHDQSVPIFQQLARDHPSGREDVRAYPLSLRNVEDLLAERGIDISHETVRFWWNRFGPMFAAEIRKKRVAHMRGYLHWRWHLDACS
jgi:hypothetical protein